MLDRTGLVWRTVNPIQAGEWQEMSVLFCHRLYR